MASSELEVPVSASDALRLFERELQVLCKDVQAQLLADLRTSCKQWLREIVATTQGSTGGIDWSPRISSASLRSRPQSETWLRKSAIPIPDEVLSVKSSFVEALRAPENPSRHSNKTMARKNAFSRVEENKKAGSTDQLRVPKSRSADQLRVPDTLTSGNTVMKLQIPTCASPRASTHTSPPEDPRVRSVDSPAASPRRHEIQANGFLPHATNTEHDDVEPAVNMSPPMTHRNIGPRLRAALEQVDSNRAQHGEHVQKVSDEDGHELLCRTTTCQTDLRHAPVFMSAPRLAHRLSMAAVRLSQIHAVNLNRKNTVELEIEQEIQAEKSVTATRRHSKMYKIVTSDLFDYLMSFILVLNAIEMGIQVDYEASNLNGDTPVVFAWLNRLFAAIFVGELMMRLYVFRIGFYFMKGNFWSCFDTFIVGVQLFEEILDIISVISKASASQKNPVNADFFRMLKMVRLLRMVRMVRLIPELKSMVYLILASMSSFLWTCVLLLLLIYMVAVFMTMTATNTLKDAPKENRSLDHDVRLNLIRYHWGSLGSAVLSAFWAITGGADWKDVIQPLIVETGNQLNNIIFIVFIAFSTMVIMNLVTGVFVEGAQRLRKEDKDKELIKMAHKTFNLVGDEEIDELEAEITREAFDQHVLGGHMDAYLAAVDLSRTTAGDLFELIDEDNSGTINLYEFIQGCMRLKGMPKAADVSQILVDVKKLAKALASRSDRALSKVDIYQERVEKMLETILELVTTSLAPKEPPPLLAYHNGNRDINWFVNDELELPSRTDVHDGHSPLLN